MLSGDKVKVPHLNLTGVITTTFFDEDTSETQYLIKVDQPLFTTGGILMEYIVSREPYVKLVQSKEIV